VIIGAAFGAIVTSLVGDILLPVIARSRAGSISPIFHQALIQGHGRFAGEAKKQGAVLAGEISSRYVINFIIIAWCCHGRQAGEPDDACRAAKPRTTSREELLMEIRDVLKAQAK